MTEFAALSSINPAAPAIDLASVAGAGIANMAVFGHILAETLDSPSPAAAPPSCAQALAIDDRQQAGGKILPVDCPALPCGLAEQASLPAEVISPRSGEVVADRDPVRAIWSGRTAASASKPSTSIQPAADGEAKRGLVTADPGDESEAAELPLMASPPCGQLVSLVSLASQPAMPVLPLDVEDAPNLPQSASRMSAMPAAAVAEAMAAPGRVAIDVLPILPAGVRPSMATSLQPPVEAPATGDRSTAPITAAPVDATRMLALSATQPVQFAASAVPGPVLRLTPGGVRAKSLRTVELAQTALPAATSVAIRGFDESRIIAPLPAAAQVFALPQPNAILTPNPTTAPAPAAPEIRQDFAALVERLIDSRNALSPQPVHTALAHTEFGEISFRFAHDERGLSVAMASADPDFAPAVQAAMPAERGERAPHDQSRGQAGSGQPPGGQGAVDDRGGHHTAPQSRATPDRNARLAADPDPGSREDDRPNRRAGIFA